MKVICCKKFKYKKLIWTYRVTLNSISIKLFYEDTWKNYLSYTDAEKERILTLLISIEAF